MALPAEKEYYTFADVLTWTGHDRISKVKNVKCSQHRLVFAFLKKKGTARTSGSFKIQKYYGQKDVAKVNVLEGCFIELCKVFTE